MAERDAHLDEPRDVRRLAAGAHVVENVGVGAVEQEADHVLRPLARVEDVDEGFAVLHREVGAVVVRRAAEQRGDRRRGVDEPGGSRDHAEPLHTLAADHHRGAGLHDADRPVLAEVTALVLPVVRGGMDHAQVGRGGRVEELGGLLERERVGVVVAVGVQPGALGLDADELVGRLVGQRVEALLLYLAEPAVGIALEHDPATGGEGLVAAVAVGQDHVDDRFQRGVEQDVEGLVGVGAVLVGDLVRLGPQGGSHGREATAVPALASWPFALIVDGFGRPLS